MLFSDCGRAGERVSNFITPIVPIERMQYTGGAGAVEIKTDAASTFDSLLDSAMKNISEVENASNADSINLALGDMNDLAQLQINTLKAESMVQTAVQLTSRVVSAYKEIMQMNV